MSIDKDNVKLVSVVVFIFLVFLVIGLIIGPDKGREIGRNDKTNREIVTTYEVFSSGGSDALPSIRTFTDKDDALFWMRHCRVVDRSGTVLGYKIDTTVQERHLSVLE